MTNLMHFPSALPRDTAIDAWFAQPNHELRLMVQPWFEALRALGPDVRELLHDGWPTACVEDAAFAYVSAFSAHANIGFYFGAELDDPSRLLEGAGKRMRHVKLRWGEDANAEAIRALIEAAYCDIKLRLGSSA
jgi:hypothetical protein